MLSSRTWSFRLLFAGVVALLMVTAPAWSTPARADTSLTDQVTVVMAVPSGGTQDGTALQQVVDAVNGTVADYWRQQSGGAIRIGVSGQVGWYQSAYTCASLDAMWTEAAQRAGWSWGTGQHLLVYVPPGSTGCSRLSYSYGSYLQSPGYVRVTELTPAVIAKGLGANLGFERSDALQCDGTVDSGTCNTTSFGDYYDVMGGNSQQLGSLSVVHAAKLGLLPAQQQVKVAMSDAPTTLSLAPVSGTTGVRGVEMSVPGGPDYWLEYRPAAGQDAWLATAANTRGLEPGVLLRAVSLGDPSLLLDGSPSSSANWGTDTHQALPVGSPVQFADGMFTVTVTAEGSSATVRVVPRDPIDAAYNASGGATGPLGAATGAETCAGPEWSLYCYRTYRNGNIYWTSFKGAHPVTGDILRAWLAAGGPNVLGLSSKDAVCGLAGAGCKQEFNTGLVYSSPAFGTHAVSQPIAAVYAAAGNEAGTLGWPTSDEICGLTAGGCGQVFQGGRIYTRPGLGTHAVTGAIQTAWIAQGWEKGPLGYPAADQVCGLADGGCKQQFQGGAIYSSSSHGTRQVSGTIGAVYAAAGGDGGALGLPTSGVICGLVGGGCGQIFQSGTIYSSTSWGTHAVSAAIATAYTAAGSQAGALGYPVADQVCGLTNSGCGQTFQGGRIYSTTATGAHIVSGAIQDAWIAQGWEKGPLGYPTSNVICGLVGGGCGQIFQGGTIYSSAAGGTRAVSGAIATAYAAAGSQAGVLGFPTSNVICGLKSGGCGQVFQGGRIYSTSATGAHAVSGKIQDAWIAQGWENGPLGYPTSDTYPVTGGTRQDFQGGTLTLDSGTGRVVRS